MVGAGSIATTSVSGRASKFGVSLDTAKEHLLEWCDRAPWLTGVHSHVGSQGCALDQLVEGARRVEELRNDVNDTLGRRQLSTIDIGGGLPTTYTSHDPFVDMSQYSDALRAACPTLFADDCQVVTEFGRSLQAHAGWATSAIEYVDERDGAPRVVAHLGADFLLRTVYQPEAWKHRYGGLDRDGNPLTGDTTPTTVFGPLCFGGDVLARDAQLPELDSDSQLVVHDVGAYTLSMWSRHCSRGIPVVIGVSRDTAGELAVRVLRNAERTTDIVRFWDEPH